MKSKPVLRVLAGAGAVDVPETGDVDKQDLLGLGLVMVGAVGGQVVNDRGPDRVDHVIATVRYDGHATTSTGTRTTSSPHTWRLAPDARLCR